MGTNIPVVPVWARGRCICGGERMLAADAIWGVIVSAGGRIFAQVQVTEAAS